MASKAIFEFEVIDDLLVENHEVEKLFFEIETEDIDYSNSEIKVLTVSIIDNDTSDNNTISGNIWQDSNVNQEKDEEEIGLEGWTVYLDLNDNNILDDNDPNVVSDSDGNYTFFNISSGTYNVRQLIPDGYSQTTPRNQFEFKD